MRRHGHKPVQKEVDMDKLHELHRIHRELVQMAEREATHLWRLARKAEEHGVSPDTVAAIREEADYCHRILTASPARMVEWDFQYKMKYAFKF